MATIQIRDVPEETYAVLRERAAADGRSIQSYMRQRLIELAARPTTAEVLARAASRPERSGGSAVEALAAVRAERDRPLDESLGPGTPSPGA